MAFSGEPSRRQDMFGGKGEVRVWNLLTTSLPPFDCVLGCELDPGGTVGKHVQEKCAEIVIVTSGRGRARVDTAMIDLEPGVVVPLPLGSILALQNGSETEPLRYFIVKAI